MAVFGDVFGTVFGDVFGTVDELTMVVNSAIENGQGVATASQALAGPPTSIIAIPPGKTLAEGAAQTNITLDPDNVTVRWDTNRGANPDVVPLNDPLTAWDFTLA